MSPLVAWTPGDVLPPWQTEITREQVARYADASGDHNPIHLDDQVARQFGLDGVIVHGMLVMGWMADYARSTLGPHDLHVFRVRFRSPVRPHHPLVFQGRIKSVENGRWEVELTVAPAEGPPAVVGTMVLSPPREA